MESLEGVLIEMGQLFHIILYIFAGAVLLSVSLQDMKTGRIADWKNLMLLGLGIADSFCVREPEIAWRFAGLFCVSGFFFLVALMTGGGIGGGDVKLMSAAGFLLGARKIMFAATVGIMLAGVCSLILLSAGKKGRKDVFALGPFLCIGILLGMLN